MSEKLVQILLEILNSEKSGLANIYKQSDEVKGVIADRMVNLLYNKSLPVKETLGIQKQALAFINIALSEKEIDNYRVNGELNINTLISACIDYACIASQVELN